MTVRVGGGQGFYGDGHLPLRALLADGVDYLVCEALAELTRFILASAIAWSRRSDSAANV